MCDIFDFIQKAKQSYCCKHSQREVERMEKVISNVTERSTTVASCAALKGGDRRKKKGEEEKRPDKSRHSTSAQTDRMLCLLLLFLLVVILFLSYWLLLLPLRIQLSSPLILSASDQLFSRFHISTSHTSPYGPLFFIGL